LFLEAVVQRGVQKGAVVSQFLTGGVPEERREELLRRIPESVLLAGVALARGWDEEAKPYILELVRNSGAIEDRLWPAIRNYRDPAFHEYVRAAFEPKLQNVRYWQSMPDLAPELPQRLAVERERIRGANDPQIVDADRLQGMLSTGDTVALDVLLRCFRNNKNGHYWPEDYLRRWVHAAPSDDKQLAGFVGESTAADYEWQAARGYFVKRSNNSQP
jgi:hypothetical protein